MPNLIIDNRPVEVPAGTKVIEAAERLGIMIPRFCYLKALGAVGACRMCAVHFKEGPVKGVQMSCMIDAKDDMVVSTNDPEAVDFRRQVIEWLMINHPHDCPVCDEGGHCLLQDETVSGGHGIRRYPGTKRTYHNQELGLFVQHEMNRCIHCYRCVRFYQEYTGYRDLGVMHIGNRIYYGRFRDGALESPFSGNLIDICPTGVFTDKPARYKARPWHTQRAPSVCIHCSMGCNTIGNGYFREVIRQEGRENEAINDLFLCDRGRYGCLFANHAERPWRPRIDGVDVGWQQVMAEAAARLRIIMAQHGPGAVAVLGSGRASLETQAMLRHCAGLLGAAGPHFFTDRAIEHKLKRAVARLDDSLAISQGAIRQADVILVIGADPLNEAPMLALSLRQAVRGGALVAVIDPRPVELPFDFVHLPIAPAELEQAAGSLVRRAIMEEEFKDFGSEVRQFLDALQAQYTFKTELAEQLADFSVRLAACNKPVIVCGTGIVRETTPDFAADLAVLMRELRDECGLFYVFPEANSFGAAIFSDPEQPDFSHSLRAMEEGAVKALVVVENDPWRTFPDRARLEKAFAGLELVVALDYLPSEMTVRAQVLCPTTTHFESGVSFINQEGRIQYARPLHEAGRPLRQVGHGSHPPRDYERQAKENLPRPAWEIIRELTASLLLESDALASLTPAQLIAGSGTAGELPPEVEYPADGVLVGRRRAETGPLFATAGPRQEQGPYAGLELILTEAVFGTEELSSYAAPIQQAAPEPFICLQAEDAAALGLRDSDTAILHLDRGKMKIGVRVSDDMARGTVVLPRHHRLAWQKLRERPEAARCRLEKA